MTHYTRFLHDTIPREQWHLTLVWLGLVPEELMHRLPELTAPLGQTFVPTVTLTHLGRGLQTRQLWAYARPTPLLEQLRQRIVERCRAVDWPAPHTQEMISRPHAFVPHIRLGLLGQEINLGPPDMPISHSFSCAKATIYQSHLVETSVRYEVKGLISLPAV